nr:glycosyltransferase family 9 protein [Pseudomonas sp.]
GPPGRTLPGGPPHEGGLPGNLTQEAPEHDSAPDGGRHEVQRQLDLVQTVGAHTMDTRMRAAAHAHDHDDLDRILAEHGVQDRRDWIVLHPGATAESRRYPAARFAQAIARLQSDAPVLVTGGRNEAELACTVCQGNPHAINLAGKLSLGQLIALIERARLLISNNSGPAHIAAATGTPVVDLYALTNPQHTPWQVANRVLNHDVPCKNCYRSVCPQGHHACLLGVEPQQVADAARELLAVEQAPQTALASAVPASAP